MVARADGLHLPVECKAELARELIDRQAINPLFAPTPGNRQNTLRQSSPSGAQTIQHMSATRGNSGHSSEVGNGAFGVKRTSRGRCQPFDAIADNSWPLNDGP